MAMFSNEIRMAYQTKGFVCLSSQGVPMGDTVWTFWLPDYRQKEKTHKTCFVKSLFIRNLFSKYLPSRHQARSTGIREAKTRHQADVGANLAMIQAPCYMDFTLCPPET